MQRKKNKTMKVKFSCLPELGAYLTSLNSCHLFKKHFYVWTQTERGIRFLALKISLTWNEVGAFPIIVLCALSVTILILRSFISGSGIQPASWIQPAAPLHPASWATGCPWNLGLWPGTESGSLWPQWIRASATGGWTRADTGPVTFWLLPLSPRSQNHSFAAGPTLCLIPELELPL